MEITETIGWIGNVVVILSFLQKKMRNLRVIGMIGAMIWVVYAIRMDSNSLLILNLVIVGIQIYHIYKLRREELKKIHPWMYPIHNTKWKQEDPPIVSSLELDEDEERHIIDRWHGDKEDMK